MGRRSPLFGISYPSRYSVSEHGICTQDAVSVLRWDVNKDSEAQGQGPRT